MQAKVKCHVKAYHLLLVYLPVILLCSLILFIYFGYVFTYLIILINPSPGELTETNYPFLHTTSPESGIIKGKILLCLITFFLTMLMISLCRTVWMDPGYFPSPLELENKVILKNSRFKNKCELNLDDETEKIISDKNKYIYSFNEVVSEGPLTFQEGINLRDEISKHTEMEVEVNKKDKYFKIENNNKNEINIEFSQESIDPFDKYINVDFNKLILCGTCLRLKAERSHHCRQCGRCVLKMDHHCPWLANCIGFNNYKYFCLLSLYGIISSVLIAFTYWETIINHNLNLNSTISEIFLSMFIYIANLGLFSFLFWLFYVNWRLVFAGQTVIENADRERFPSTKTMNIYDLGYFKNFTIVFGNNPLVWFIPFFANYSGKGICFETNIIRE